MAVDRKAWHEEVLSYTPEQWERYKWVVEREIQERDVILKEREDRRSFIKSPLILSIVGAIIAFLVNVASDAWTKSRHLAQTAREAESAMIQKAMDQDDPTKVVARLRLLDAAGMIPRHRNQLVPLWTDEKSARLFLAAQGGGDKPDAAAAPSQPCDKAQSTGQAGWLYLGRASKLGWVGGEKGSDLIRWEAPLPGGVGFLEKAKGTCLHVAHSKFLRDDGPIGEKRKAPVKTSVTPTMRLRVTELDEGDPKSTEPHRTIWGHVEILAD